MLFAFFAFVAWTQAQSVTVSGTVVGKDDGQPVIGANIVIKGTTTGTVSDVDGHFRLTAPRPGATLVISFVGYRTKEVPATASMHIELETDATQLGEVQVVVAYGQQKRRELTGAIGSVDAASIRETPATSLEQTLSGRVSGVQVTQASGAPGGAVVVNIRGTSSISAGNEPLYVVDGMPILSADFSQKAGYQGNTLSGVADINPADIASVEVLKDASAAALYGSRASNGVVLITTKRGSSGRTRVTLDSYVGVQNLWRKLQFLPTAEHVAARNEAINNYNNSLGLSSSDATYKKPVAAAQEGADTDWIDAITRTALHTNHQLALSGGTDQTQFYASLGYYDQQGVMKKTDYTRYNLRTNLTNRISRTVKISADIALSSATTNRATGDGNLYSPWINALSASPDYAVRTASGSFGSINASKYNPVALIDEQEQVTRKYRAIVGLKTTWNILPELRYNLDLGGDYIVMHETGVFPRGTIRGARSNGDVHDLRGFSFSNLAEHTLDYFHQWDKLAFKALLGYSYQKTTLDNNFVRGTNFVSPMLKYINSAGSVTEGSSSLSEYALQSLFGRVNLNYADRYLLEASLRSDASSKFAPGRRVGYFPAASLGWIVSEEGFFPKTKTLSNLKLRAAVGYTGNQEGIGYYDYFNTYRASDVAYIGQSGLAFPNSRPNPDLTWEKTLQYDLGVDAALFDRRLELTLDWYHKDTRDLLLSHPINALSGYTRTTSNVGRIRNEGFEAMITGHPLRGRGLTWDVRLSFGYQHNEVVALTKKADGTDNFIEVGPSNILQVGRPMATFYLIRAEGIYQSKEEILAQPGGEALWKRGIRPGDVKYYDKDGNGIINNNDRVTAGSPFPKITGAFINNFAYKGFDLGLDLQYSLGAKIYATWKGAYTGGGGQGGTPNGYAIFRDEFEARWTPERPSNDRPRAVADGAAYTNNMMNYTTRFLEKADFLRIRNVTLGYTLPDETVRHLGLSRLRFYAQVNNLYTFTTYDGFDPEVAMNPDRATYRGYDSGSVPHPRSFLFGMNLSF